MLFLVILGALALASLMGNVVYRLSRARHVARAAARRRDIWESADPARSPSSADPQPGNRATRTDFAGRPDFARADIQASPSGKGVEQIEEFIEKFLVRLSKLSQGDMESLPSR
jgi:Tfp pilus assembly protein PilV